MGESKFDLALAERAHVESLELRRMLAAGVLDTSFDGDGKFFGAAGAGNTFTDLLTQPSGKILAVGQIATTPRYSLVRYNQNGTLDLTFGGGDGIADLPAGVLKPFHLAADSTGRIIVAGVSSTITADNKLTVLRFDANGNPDATFGTSGVSNIAMAGLRQINAITMQSDDRIVLGGAFFSTSLNFGLIRLTTGGGLDTTFEGDGSVIIDNGQTEDIYDVAVMSDGAILGAGTAGTDWAFVKLTSTGARYSGFGPAGIVLGPAATSGAANALAAMPDNTFFVAGAANSALPNQAAALGHFNVNGTADTNFGGGDGVLDLQPAARYSDIAVLPNGKLVVTGSNGDVVTARYLTNGSLDSTFGAGGVTTTDFSGADGANAVTLAPDGRVVVAGDAASVGQPILARYTNEGIVNQQADGSLRVAGTDANDTLSITPRTGGYDVNLNGAIQTIPRTATLLNIALAGGDDTVTINGLAAGALPQFGVDLGTGTTDTLILNGTANAETLQLTSSGFAAGAGPPSTFVAATIDSLRLNGLDGNDTLLVAYNCPVAATLDGGIGSDLLSFEGTAAADNITVTPTGISGRSFTELNVESLRVRGLAGADTIATQTGITLPMSIDAGDDNDTIFAKQGTRETIDGGNGTDRADIDTTDVVTNVELFDANYIQGLVFNDLNTDGVQQTGEATLSGRTVYIDANNSGTLDAGDTSQLTTSSGYTFSTLAAGPYVIREIVPTGWVQTFPANNAGWNVTLVNGTPQTGINFGTQQPIPQTPFFGTPFNITTTAATTIQAEDFDNGGEAVAYHDIDTANQGGAYRTTGVDLQPASTGGFNVGWIAAGEWLEYTANVTAGTYDFSAKVASLGTGGTFHVEFGGINQTGALAIPNTNGWQNWTTVTKRISVLGGQQVVRVFFDTAGTSAVGNLDWIKFAPVTTGTTQTITSTIGALVRDGIYADQNFGSTTQLIAKNSTGDYTRESYIKFDISSLTTISNAKLQLFGNLALTTPASLTANVYASSNTTWDENTITWNSRPVVTTALGPIAVTGTTPTIYQLDLTSFLQSEKALGHTQVTIVLRGATTSDTQIVFNSDDAASNQPKLIVTA